MFDTGRVEPQFRKRLLAMAIGVRGGAPRFELIPACVNTQDPFRERVSRQGGETKGGVVRAAAGRFVFRQVGIYIFVPAGQSMAAQQNPGCLLHNLAGDNEKNHVNRQENFSNHQR